MTHAKAAAAPAVGAEVIPRVHDAVDARNLLPRVQGTSTDFLSGELFVANQREFGVGLLGPMRRRERWQASAHSIGMEHVAVD